MPARGVKIGSLTSQLTMKDDIPPGSGRGRDHKMRS